MLGNVFARILGESPEGRGGSCSDRSAAGPAQAVPAVGGGAGKRARRAHGECFYFAADQVETTETLWHIKLVAELGLAVSLSCVFSVIQVREISHVWCIDE